MRTGTRSFYEQAVQQAVEHVIAHLDDALDLRRLARIAALSPFHFHRVFRGLVGETPLELHRRLRLERAAWTLCSDDSPVTTIAFAAGYETHESFTRAFRAHYACAPSELRRRGHRDDPGCTGSVRVELAARSGIHFRADGAGAACVQLIHAVPDLEVALTERPALRLAALSHVGPYHRISDAFAHLVQLVAVAGPLAPDTAMIAIYHDDPETTPPSELRADAAIVLSPEATVPAGVREQRLPAGRFACTIHVGPSTHLGDTWARFLGAWLPHSGQRMRDGVSYELHRAPAPGASPDQAGTALYLPIV